MTDMLGSWWRARTERERLLLQVSLWLVFVILAPMLVWQGAQAYRQQAAAELAAAQSLQTLVERIDPALAARGAMGQQGVEAFVSAEAQALNLTLTRIEAQGPELVRFVFAPGDSLAVLTLIDRLARAGLSVDRTVLSRADEAGLVTAELDVRGAGS